MSNWEINYDWGLTKREGIAIVADQVPGPIRQGRYSEKYATWLDGGKMHPLANEGSYFFACNPTPGTEIISVAAESTLSDQKALMLIRNTDPVGGRYIYLDYIKLQVTTAGANGTNTNWVMKIDDTKDRYVSGGSVITPVCPNMDSSASPACKMYFGAVVPTTAGANVRIVDNIRARTVIKVVGDTVVFSFAPSQQHLGNMAAAGTAVSQATFPCPPVVIGPAETFLLHEYCASQDTAAGYQFSMGFYQR